jgi:hypothetical protein
LARQDRPSPRSASTSGDSVRPLFFFSFSSLSLSLFGQMKSTIRINELLRAEYSAMP